MNLSRFYAVNRVAYCRNFIFKRHFPIHRIFERSCEMGLWRITANKVQEIFGSRIAKKWKGKLNTKNAFVKQYEKFSTFLRNEVCSNNLTDFKLKKDLNRLAGTLRSRWGRRKL